MLSLPNSAWFPYIAWARVALAAGALALTYAYPIDRPAVFPILMGVYLAYTIVLATRFRRLSGALGLLALFGDTVFFLILASSGEERLTWMAALFLLHLLTEALLFYIPLEVGVIAGVCTAFCAMLPYGSIRALLPTALVAGTLAVGFAKIQKAQKERMDTLSENLAKAQQATARVGEQERQRIASDFHDGPLQSFISLQMRLEILRKLLEQNFLAGMEDLRELQTIAQSQIRDLRVFLHSMRPVDVDGANLVATARRAAELFQKETGLPVTFLGTTTPVGLPQEMTLEVLQMLREALHNVQKHSEATRVAVAMEKTDLGLEISIDDNGKGFPFHGEFGLEELELGKMGPASLKRRARSIGADLLVHSRTGSGTGLKFRIPLQ